MYKNNIEKTISVQMSDALHILDLIAGNLLVIDKSGRCIRLVSTQEWPSGIAEIHEDENFIDLIPVVQQSSFKILINKVLHEGGTRHFRIKKNVAGGIKYLSISLFKYSDSAVLLQIREEMMAENDPSSFSIKEDSDPTNNLDFNYLIKVILEYAPFLVFVKDVTDDFRYIYNNVAFTKLQEDIPYIGKNDFDFLPLEIANRYQLEDRLVINTGEPQRFIHTHSVDDIEYITETLKMYVDDREHNPILIGIVRDVTEQFKKHRDLLNDIDKTKESESLKLNFIANLSQEIRTPLNSIVGFSELLVGTEENETRAHYKNQIEESSKRLILIIDELLDLTRMKSGQIELNYSEVSPFSLCEEIYGMYKGTKHKLTQLSFIESDSTLIIISDGIRLFQAISYIINTACRLTFDGKIDFGFYKEDDFFYFYVIGTALNYGEEIFEAISSHGGRNQNIQAAIILELSLSKSIIESMGGTFYIEEWGSGTKQSFKIPLV